MGLIAFMLGLQSNEAYDRERAARRAEDKRQEAYQRNVVEPHRTTSTCENGRCRVCGPL
jgi:hypothetical protein